MRAIALLALAAFCVLGAGAERTPPNASGRATPLHIVQTIPMASVEGRIDHLAIDLSARRLFVCALGNGTVEVVDLEKGQRVQSVPGFKEPQGIVFMPKTKTVAVASGGDGHLSFLEGPRSRQASPDRYVEGARVRTAEGARTGLFSPELGRLFVAVPHRANAAAEIRVFVAVP